MKCHMLAIPQICRGFVSEWRQLMPVMSDGGAIFYAPHRFGHLVADGVAVAEAGLSIPKSICSASATAMAASISFKAQMTCSRSLGGLDPAHGQTVFQLLYDERRKIDGSASGIAQLSRARHGYLPDDRRH